MKRLLKLLGWIAAGLIALIAIAAVAVPLLFDPNDYRDTIAAEAKKATGRELVISGDLELSVFPWLAVKSGAIELGNAEGFGEQPFAAIRSAEFRVQLLPLLKREIRIGHVLLDGLRLNLARDAQGHSNWEDLAQPAQAGTEEEPETHPEDAPPLAALAIEGLTLSDAQLLWDDRQSGQRSEITAVNLESGAIAIGQAFPVKLSLALANSSPEIAGRLELSGNLELDPQAQHYRVAELNFSGDLKGGMLPGGALQTTLAANLMVDLTSEQLTLDHLKLVANGAQLQGEAEIHRLLASPAVDGRISLRLEDAARLLAPFSASLPPAFEASALNGSQLESGFRLDLEKQTLALEGFRFDGLGSRLSLQLKARSLLGDPAADGALELTINKGEALAAPIRTLLPPELKPSLLDGTTLRSSYSLDMAKQSASLSDLQLSGAGLELSANLKASRILDAPRADGSLALKPFSPRTLLGQLGITLPPMADPKALGRAELDIDLSASSESVALKRLDLRLDDSRLSGSTSVGRFAAPRIRYQLSLDRIDLDRYLPPESKGQGKATTPPATAQKGATELPLELLRSLDIDGTLTVGSLKAAKLNLSSLSTTLKAGKGLFQLKPFSLRLYDGSVRGDARFDVRGQQPALATNTNVSTVNLGKLFTDMSGEPLVEGIATADASLKATGLELAAIRRSLSGTAKVKLDHGMVKGINLGQSIRELYATYKEQPKPPKETRDSDYTNLSASFSINKGRVSNKDLRGSSPLLRLSGHGQTNLVSESIDYEVKVRVVPESAQTFSMQDFRGIDIPVDIEGTYSKPEVKPDYGSVVEQVAKRELRKRAEEEKARVEERVKDEVEKQLGDQLKGLFGR